jgi:WD40 repeat protein
VFAIAVPQGNKDQTLAVGADQKIVLWNLASSPPLSQTLSGHTSIVYRLAFSPDGAWLASSSCAKTDKNSCVEGEVFLWDRTARPPAIKHKLAGHTNWVSGLAFSPDSKRLVTSSWDTTISLWDVATGNRLGQPLTGYQTRVDSLALSPDGNTLAVGYLDPQSDAQAGNIDVWNLAAAQPTRVQTLHKAHTRQVLSLVFSPDGKLLASAGGDRNIVIWDVKVLSNIKALQTLAGHFRAVNSIAFSPDGKYLASGSDDKTVIVWDLAGGNIIGRPLGGYTDLVSSVAFSSDGQFLASASLDGVISLWNLNFAAWQAQACQQAGRNLSLAEWAQYFGSVPYHKTCQQWPAGK